MYIGTLLLVICLLVLGFFSFTEAFPRCTLCGMIKPRTLIKIHMTASILPWRRGRRTACRKCSRKYGINDLEGLEQVLRIKQKVRDKTRISL